MPNNEEVTYLERLTENNTNLGDVDDVTSLLPSSTTTQEQKLAQLEELLKGKAGIPQKPNVFVQTTEPSKKDGIWFKTSGSIDHYIIDDSVYTAGNWSAAEDTTRVPSGYTFSGSVVVALGTDIYLFGAYTYNGAINIAYKYDTLTDTYTRLTDVPYTYSSCCGAAVGTDIFLFGVGNNSYIYKYNTLTDTYTMMRVASIWVSGTLAVAIGTDIFLTGGNVGSNVYKYNTLTDTTANVGSLPIKISMNGVAIGTDIYVFGGENTGNDVKAYKYDTLTNTYTRLTDCPITMLNGKSTAVGTDIYLMTNNSNSFYKYNISTDTYTQLTNIPFSNYMR